MVGKGLSSSSLEVAISVDLFVFVLVGLQDGVEPALVVFDLFVSDSVDLCGGLAERFLGAFVFLVDVHLCFPGVEAVLVLIDYHAVAFYLLTHHHNLKT